MKSQKKITVDAGYKTEQIYKLWQVKGNVCLFLAVFLMIGGTIGSSDGDMSQWDVLMGISSGVFFFLGFSILAVIKFLIWWRHG